MATIEKTEKVDIVYENNKIIIRGRSFELSAQVGATDLAAIYMSGKGEAQATLSVDVPDAPTQKGSADNVPAPPKKSRKKTKTLAEVKADQPDHKYNPDG